MLAIYLTHLS